MKFWAPFLPLCLAAVPVAVCQDEESPTLQGYVTRVASVSDFDVNGLNILCGQHTHSRRPDEPRLGFFVMGPSSSPYLGQRVTIYGDKDKKLHAVKATEIVLEAPSYRVISGSAVVDALPMQEMNGPQIETLLVRADGYLIRITGKTEIAWTERLHSLTDVKPGVWIDYKGTQEASGVVAATYAKLSPNIISKGEEQLRVRSDFYEPPAQKKPGKTRLADKASQGIDPAKFPPFNNPAMQARVSAIGDKLIPAFERDLPDSDRAKIHIRFLLIDRRKWHDALALPSGLILIPYQLVERLQNDTQLATVLADNIAAVLERQLYRSLPAIYAIDFAEIGEGFVPYAGLGVQAATDATASKILIEKFEEQSGRVSLGLLHDAGFDIDQAPIAWWLLASKQPKPIAEIPIPARAANLYRALGESWHNPETVALEP